VSHDQVSDGMTAGQ